MNRNRAVATIAGTWLALVLLAGCAAGGGASGDRDPQVTSPVPTLLNGDANGDGRLSEFEKQALAHSAPREIPLDNGTSATIIPGQPLPQTLTAQIAREAAPGVMQVQSLDEFEMTKGWRSIVRVAESYAEKLSRPVGIAYRDGYGYWGAVTSDDEGVVPGLVGSADKDSVVAAVGEWAAADNAYIVVVD